ncbi:MAG: hypothetical protein AUI36_05840 [Cyanobacteria bacterium 13_1_40CM_2_61_4]|nr:MAG: hypothetical protein AUI36_05840 [Cyanobacteria bacterium 13_1_40CM_2_61_4]
MKKKNEKAATATIEIDGLAICCYVINYNRWDIGVLRDPQHRFTLSVGHDDLPVDAAKRVRIYPVSQIMPGQNEDYPGGCYDAGNVDRRGSKDPDNMRWVMDLNNSRDVGQDGLELQKPKNPVTKVEVSGSVFRCGGLFPLESEKKKFDMYLVPHGKDPNKIKQTELDKYRLGKISDLIVGEIGAAAALKIEIDIDGKKYPYEVPPGSNLEIRVMNMDAKSHLRDETAPLLYKGDFHLYYDAIKNANQQFALWGPLRPTEKIPAEMVDFRTDCNAVWLSEAENIDVLFS